MKLLGRMNGSGSRAVFPATVFGVIAGTLGGLVLAAHCGSGVQASDDAGDAGEGTESDFTDEAVLEAPAEDMSGEDDAADVGGEEDAADAAPRCTGYHVPCWCFYGETDCEFFGCIWSERDSRCWSFSNNSAPCYTYHDETSCAARYPCIWDALADADGSDEAGFRPPDCTCPAKSCDYLTYSPAGCAAQEGCEWEAASATCTGTAVPCDAFLEREPCVAQMGCGWIFDDH